MAATSIYYFSALPTPSSLRAAPYRMLQDQEREDCEERRRFEESESALATASVDMDKCLHPDSMHDEMTNACASCGLHYGVRVAPMTESALGFAGAHHHSYSSATASAAARRKRTALTATLAVSGNACVDVSGEQGRLAMKTLSGGANRGAPDIANAQKRRPAFSTSGNAAENAAAPNAVAIDSIELFQIVVSQARPATYSSDSLESRRARVLSGLAIEAFMSVESARATCGTKNRPTLSLSSETMSILASGAYTFDDREPCDEAMALVANGESPTNINNRVIGEVYRIVFENPAYFNSPQRRRLHHLALFVAVISAHVREVHGGSGPRAAACLELDRVRARAKPSQSRFTRRSLPFAIATRVGVNSTCATRLVQEAFSLMGPASDSDLCEMTEEPVVVCDKNCQAPSLASARGN